MVNYGFNPTFLLGLIDILAALCYLAISIYFIFNRVIRLTSLLDTIEKVGKLLVCPIALFLSGVILFFNSWRLSSILGFQQLLLHLIIYMAIAKEIMELVLARR